MRESSVMARPGSRSLAGSRVALVGAGIVNLVTALELARAGASIEVFEASPDPRTRPDWRLLGTTHGGENARMFCFTEADNHNAKLHASGPGASTFLRRTISEGGWLAVKPAELDPDELDWIDDFHRLSPEQAQSFASDVHRFNAESHPLWQRLESEIPHLFDGVSHTTGILQIYSRAERAENAWVLHERLGSLTGVLEPAELARHHPTFRDAVTSGEIARALEIRGFTLEIHGFSARLLDELETRGVRFRWQERVSALERAEDGCIVGLRLGNGDLARAEHYVLSPGAHGGTLLDGTRSAGKIQGVVGLWFRMPNLEPRLRHSVKIHRGGHVGEDSNVILAREASGQPILILGAGYGFLGRRPIELGSPELTPLFAALEDTARRCFPRSYRAALRQGSLRGTHRACVRPFTSTGLGLFEVIPTAQGGHLIIASGHNTGGFAQAPAVAEAVRATLEGREHPMRELYHPDRGRAYRMMADTTERS